MFEKKLEELREKGLFRHIISRASPQGPTITIEGRKYVNFSSNDYLGFANHPAIIRAAGKSIRKSGFGPGASRLLGGGSVLHKELEARVSSFKSAEAAVVFSSGYSANTGIIPAISSVDDVIFSDELNHASIIDGCRLSGARTVIYRHRGISGLKELIKKEKAKRKIIITDSVFSMDGDIAPLMEIYGMCKTQNSKLKTQDSILLYIDDAHGTGVLGKGRGALAHFNIKPEPWIIQMGTFSKALGSFGAYAAAGKDIIEWISNTARSFIFSTALPPCVISASLAAVELLEKEPFHVKKLWSNRKRLIKGIKKAGYDIMGSETPIIPIGIGDIRETLRLSAFLFENRIYAPVIRPPTVRDPRIRITASAAHSEIEMDLLLNTLKRFR